MSGGAGRRSRAAADRGSDGWSDAWSDGGSGGAAGGTPDECVVALRDVFCVHRSGQGDAAALQGTNLELARGELLCVLGPSGAGKSTLLRVIAGLQPPSAGAVIVLGQDIGRISARARAQLRHRRFGLLAQSPDRALAPALPAGRAVELPLALRGVAVRERRARVDELLAATGLSDRAGALPEELSGGERQRLALCAALAHRPALLLADEPTGELDETSAQAIRELIASLARDDGTSVIVASHDATMATIADRSVRLAGGRVVAERRGSEEALVIDARGWLALPAEVLSQAGLQHRARVQSVQRGLTLTAAGSEHERPPSARPRARAPDCRDPRLEHGEDPHTERNPQTERGGEPQPRRLDYGPARVQLRAATRRYGSARAGRLVIAELTHEFAASRLTAVTGRSGSGKTTLLRILAGLDRPDTGELLIDGLPLGGCDREQLASLRRARIGYMSQAPAPPGFLSAQESIALALRVRGASQPAADARAREALARVGLAERATQRLARLSAGETQRVALARALASARGLLIADEPTSRLDELGTGAVAKLLADAAADGHTVICSTHDAAVIAHADAVLALR